MKNIFAALKYGDARKVHFAERMFMDRIFEGI
jgi:hypothetical protein